MNPRMLGRADMRIRPVAQQSSGAMTIPLQTCQHNSGNGLSSLTTVPPATRGKEAAMQAVAYLGHMTFLLREEGFQTRVP
jgi:hypothetical protein